MKEKKSLSEKDRLLQLLGMEEQAEEIPEANNELMSIIRQASTFYNLFGKTQISVSCTYKGRMIDIEPHPTTKQISVEIPDYSGLKSQQETTIRRMYDSKDKYAQAANLTFGVSNDAKKSHKPTYNPNFFIKFNTFSIGFFLIAHEGMWSVSAMLFDEKSELHELKLEAIHKFLNDRELTRFKEAKAILSSIEPIKLSTFKSGELLLVITSESMHSSPNIVNLNLSS